jgi:uncharacterized protein DUF3551
MRVLVLLISVVSLVSVAGPVKAQTYDPDYPVCMQLTEWGGGRIDCSYRSLAECRATGSGRGAMCVINPYYGFTRRGRHY